MHAVGDTSSQPGWERKTVETLAMATLVEQRRRRRWGVFFKFLGFAYVGFFFWQVFDLGSWLEDAKPAEAHTALIKLDGAVGVKGGIEADQVTAALRNAFRAEGVKGIVLRINSPGGSPVQSAMLYDEIRRLRALHKDKPLHVVVSDVCASGGYYIAAAADKIYVNESSLIGSIGVLLNGFGFTGTMERMGVERRLMTAGENKAFLDPFSPISPVHEAHAKQMLGEIHETFIKAVKEGRGQRLKASPELFSGLIWTGRRGLELGLADGYGTAGSVARDVIGAERIVDYSEEEAFFERFARRLGASFGAALVRFEGWSLR